MGIRAGIVGITNIGKTTIFNALTSSEAESTNYSFSTIKPNTAVVDVPDYRVDEIFAHVTSAKKVYNHLEIMDIAGLVKGASRGEGLGNKFLSDIKLVDAILHIVRCFEDENVVHVDKTVNPKRDIENVETELIVKDLETVENRISKNEKLAKARNKEAMDMQPLYEKLFAKMSELEHPRTLNLTEQEKEMLKDMNLLTLKPVIFVCNISEDELMEGKDSQFTLDVKEIAKNTGCGAVKICGKVEAELSLLSAEEKAEFLKDYGLAEPGLNLLIRETYNLLGLGTYLTEGEIEVKAWNIRQGMTAPQAAGVIHSDLERGFIRAEVMKYDDYVRLGSEHACKEAGKLGIEGKNYVVGDGDILHIRFNV